MTALTVGVDEGVGDGVGLTGHVLGVGVGVGGSVKVKGSSTAAGAAPLCADAAIGRTNKPDSSIRHRRGLRSTLKRYRARTNSQPDLRILVGATIECSRLSKTYVNEVRLSLRAERGELFT